MKIEEKLQQLADCGLKLKPEFGVQDLVDAGGREGLDKPGYDLALVLLGSMDEETESTPLCDQLWHFDTECIDGPGSYVRIAQRMADMAGGSLPLSDIEDHVDLDEEQAWLRFRCAGKPVHIDCQMSDDWVDPEIFGHFARLLAEHDANKLFIYHDLGGQDCIIGCVTRDQYQKLLKVIPTVLPLS